MYVALHNWPLFTVESAVLVVGLLHIYLELRKRKEPLPVRIIVWYIDKSRDVRKKVHDKK